RMEWGDQVQPPGAGEKVLFMLHSGEEACVALLATTGLGAAVDAQCRGIVRCDAEDAAVDAWGTYQQFELGQRVYLQRPGDTVRVGIIGPDSLPDDTDIYVQLYRE
ncbi:MAG: hypothetical protein J7M26_05125, partial [Armatimonadetes bacterium]|nr:hypothetical protein [Armatimonadota bacterium]